MVNKILEEQFNEPTLGFPKPPKIQKWRASGLPITER
jgi:hypothetical protein